jgi:hypothetical protein
MRTIQKNIRVTEDVANWMNKHPLSDNSLVNYGLHLLMQMEANATMPLQGFTAISFVPPPEDGKIKKQYF